MHAKLHDLRTFTETFLFHFGYGVNGEYVSQSKELFYLIYDRLAEAGIEINEEIGGHSIVWAKRAQIEGCDAFIAAHPTEFTMRELPLKSATQSAHLIHPVDRLTELNQDSSFKKDDIHLVFEYVGGDEIFGIKAPRSNRMYFVHDPNGGKFAQLPSYHELVTTEVSHQPYRHMFGGYQLL